MNLVNQIFPKDGTKQTHVFLCTNNIPTLLSFNFKYSEERSTNKAAMRVGRSFDKKGILPWNIVDVNELAVFPGELVREPNSFHIKVAPIGMHRSKHC